MALPDTDAAVEGLVDYVDASPSPFHVVQTSTRLLDAAGFTEVLEAEPFPGEPGRYYVVRGGSLVAWSTQDRPRRPVSSFRVVGAHTDSPNLRIKPAPDHARVGWQLLGVESYGGPLLASWLDRDLGLSGRVAVRRGDEVEARLFLADEPLLRVAQLAIHLSEAPKTSLTLNVQQHLAPDLGPRRRSRRLPVVARRARRRPPRGRSRLGRHDPRRRALAAHRPRRRSSSPPRAWTTR